MGAVDGESWADRSRAWEAPPSSPPRTAPRRRLSRTPARLGPELRPLQPVRTRSATARRPSAGQPPCGVPPSPSCGAAPPARRARRRRRGPWIKAAAAWEEEDGGWQERRQLRGDCFSRRYILVCPRGAGVGNYGNIGPLTPRLFDCSRWVGSGGRGGGGGGAGGRLGGSGAMSGREWMAWVRGSGAGPGREGGWVGCELHALSVTFLDFLWWRPQDESRPRSGLVGCAWKVPNGRGWASWGRRPSGEGEVVSPRVCGPPPFLRQAPRVLLPPAPSRRGLAFSGPLTKCVALKMSPKVIYLEKEKGILRSQFWGSHPS